MDLVTTHTKINCLIWNMETTVTHCNLDPVVEAADMLILQLARNQTWSVAVEEVEHSL